MSSINIEYTLHEGLDTLSEDDLELIRKSKDAAQLAYAPYSHFRVGACARLSDGELVMGSNQENASFPAGICAERVLLSTASTIAPGKSLLAMAISCYSNDAGVIEPVAPCGICRQSLVEFESRIKTPIRLLLVGANDTILEFKSASDLLPLAFTPGHLGK